MDEAMEKYYNSQIKNLNKKIEEQTKTIGYLFMGIIAILVIATWLNSEKMEKSYNDGWKAAEEEYYESRYEEGYNDGIFYSDVNYEDGYEKGYEEGNSDGYWEGYNKAVAEAEKNRIFDFEEGYDEGWVDALAKYGIEE